VRPNPTILNFTPGPQGRTSPLGVHLAPTGEICFLGEIFTPSLTPRGEQSLLFRRMEGQTEFHPQGTKFTPGGQIRPWGQSLPLGAKLRADLRVIAFLLKNFIRSDHPK
jgi:hypothetical protein